MEKIKKLVSLCKAGVILEVNENRNYYQSVNDYIHSIQDEEEISQEIIDKMIELNTVVSLQFYPDTPIGSYTIWHYDIDMAIDEALGIIKE